MFDLNQAVNDQMKALSENGFVAEVIKKQLEKTIESVVSDLFRSYGDFGKALEKQVQEALNVDFDNLNLPSYNALIVEVIREKLDDAVQVQGIERIQKQLDEMLNDVKPEYKLSEIISEMMESENEDHERDGSEISLHIDDRYSLIFIYFDPEEDVSEYSCKYRITVRKGDNTVMSVKFDDKEIDKKSIMSGFYKLESTLFKLYATSAKLIIDKDQIGTYYADSED